jgi:hypothetical protein
LFKAIALRLATHKEDERPYVLLAIDVYIVLKWATILGFWLSQAQNLVATTVSWYLLATNLFTYFYYHVWDEAAQMEALASIERIRRRFLNSLQAFFFSITLYAYFYDVLYASDFTWSGGHNLVTSWYFSIGNALTVTYGDVTPCSSTGKLIAVAQLAITFFFVTTIIAKTLASTLRRNGM